MPNILSIGNALEEDLFLAKLPQIADCKSSIGTSARTLNAMQRRAFRARTKNRANFCLPLAQDIFLVRVALFRSLSSQTAMQAVLGKTRQDCSCDNSTVLQAIMTNPLIQKLEKRDDLSAAEREALERISLRTRTCRFGETIVRQNEHLTSSTLLLEGFAARAKTLKNGKRQIMAVHISGDFVDLHSFPLKRIDHTIEALTPCKIASVSHADLEVITETFPHLTRMLWLSTAIDAAIHRAWLVAMGRLSSHAQVAHFVCEMYLRLQSVELTQGQSFRLPFTQAELGDIMGLSSVHVNRVIQDLRIQGLLRWQDQIITINDWDRLAEEAEFDPTYLSLQREHR